MNPVTHEQREQTALRTEVRRLLANRIDDLPDAFRIVFMPRALEEMTVEETAECPDIPEAAVRTRYIGAKSASRRAFARNR